MNAKLIIAAAVGAILLSGAAEAAPRCAPTQRVSVSEYPGASAIPSTNNLMLPTGKATPIEGQQVIVHGRVVDQHCLPVTEATVELWQADPYGKHFIARGEDIVTPSPTFAGAGRTVTDKNGAFTFITAFPGSVSSKVKNKTYITHAPQLNLKVKARGFESFSTAVFFANDKRNANDPAFQKLNPEVRRQVTLTMGQDQNQQLVGKIDLVLPGEAPYQTY